MLATMAQVVRTLETGTYTLSRIYALCQDRADTRLGGGHDPVPGHPRDLRWKHQVRGAIVTLRRAGRASRIDRAVWAIQGTPQRPQRLLLIVAGATLAEFELRLEAAASLLASLGEPADLILCDPPWALGRGRGHFADGNGYRRDHTKVVPGYVDVEPENYAAFTREWVRLAAAALRPAGQLAVITGPQRAAVVQCAAEDAGLTWVTSIAAPKEFPIATVRRPSPAHWTVTVMVRGSLSSSRRVFNPPADQPRARSGHPYPLDVWYGNGRADRPGLLRYDNSLPLTLASRAVLAFSNPGDLVVDPAFGGGTIPVACFLAGRRFMGGDVNPGAVSFTAARLLDEHAWPALLTMPGLAGPAL